MDKPILAWMNCYGAWAPELRDPIETAGYSEYLDAVVDHLAVLKSRLSALYVSGGMRDEQGRTECETTIPELRKRLEVKGITDLEIVADEESLSSITIDRIFLRTWRDRYSDHYAILFCDEARYPTNAYVLEYFGAMFGIELPPISEILIPLNRRDIHPNSRPEVQVKKLLEMKMLGVEEVERRIVESRAH